MMRLLKSSVLVMAMVATFSLTLTTGAHALLVLRFSDGIGGATTVNDNGPGDADPTTGIILAAPSDGNFSSFVQIATSSTPTPLLNFTSFNNARGTGGTLTIELSDINFALGATAATLVSTFNIPGSIFPSTATSVNATQCADLSNTPFLCTPAATVNHGPFGPTGSDITSVKTVSYTSTDPFAITEKVVLVFAGPGSSDFNFSSRV